MMGGRYGTDVAAYAFEVAEALGVYDLLSLALQPLVGTALEASLWKACRLVHNKSVASDCYQNTRSTKEPPGRPKNAGLETNAEGRQQDREASGVSWHYSRYTTSQGFSASPSSMPCSNPSISGTLAALMYFVLVGDST